MRKIILYFVLFISMTGVADAQNCPGKPPCPAGFVETESCDFCCETGSYLSTDKMCCMDTPGVACEVCEAGSYIVDENLCCPIGTRLSADKAWCGTCDEGRFLVNKNNCCPTGFYLSGDKACCVSVAGASCCNPGKVWKVRSKFVGECIPSKPVNLRITPH